MKKKKATQKPATPPRLKQYETLIFITGAVTLSLEVLASRIMTPYFGVSLYIWAGILSITLIFLALGYQLGGQMSRRRDQAALQNTLLAAPLWAALSIVVATVLYPMVFPLLSTINLIVASFVGGIILLALPLVVLSGMNPLLIALARDVQPTGDGGAGRVFFISTVGSVAGVLLTAFLIIPHLTNFRALLWLSLGLGVLVGGIALLNREIPGPRRKLLLGGCILVLLLGGAMLVGQRSYFKLLAGMSDIGKDFEVLAEYTSVFGNIKVLAVHPEDKSRQSAQAYLQDGIIQNMVTADGMVLDHTEFMDRLVDIYAPKAQNSLVLGLAAGMIPRYLKSKGLKVTAVEINPNSLQAATEFFKFDPREVDIHIEDARTFVRRHRGTYDLLITDLFHGDCTPDYLLTVEFFQEVEACLRPQGVVIINTYFDPNNEPANDTILATVSAVFPHVLELRSPSSAGLVSSTCLVAAKVPLSPEAAIQAADRGPMPSKDYQTLKAARIVDREMLKDPTPVSDDHNIFSILFAGSQLRYRSQFNKLPPNLLVN
ncbi:MAG: fused MFS/spermidine synthase [Syntrophobacterales bacterium]|nr:fused MFS/spermidine synthase [Syntrophobacterales bacterium]